MVSRKVLEILNKTMNRNNFEHLKIYESKLL